jgi:protein involved in polysaccharide export with SLBB domain
MEKYQFSIQSSSKLLRYPFLCRLSLFMAFTVIGALLQGDSLLAADRPGERDGNTNGLTLKYSTILPATMNLPLSTWVGPGDVLRIKSFPDTGSFISGNYVIIDSGCVILPIIGSVQVTHLSINELAIYLTDGYAKYLAYPTIQIEPLIHLLLLGGFLRPGTYLINPLHPFSSALSAAGGTIRDDGLKLLRWERNGAVLATDLTAKVESTQSLWALGFKSGDQICITLRTRRDMLPVVSFVISTFIATGTLALTLLVVLK